MPLPERSLFSQRFLDQLARIREDIEALPEAKRPQFRVLADEAERNHRSMESNCARVRELVDDMRLNEAAARFDIWAAADNLRRTLV